MNSYVQPCLVGHPYAPIGMGEHVRCTFRAFRVAGVTPTLVDIYGLISPQHNEVAEFSEYQADHLADVNIFHINGDEVEQSLAHLSDRYHSNKYNVIYPAWELSRYPSEWAQKLDEFDEIWAPSIFIKDALAAACSRKVIHMPLACEVKLNSFLGRRYFGIPETDYAFLFFFDVRSYASRKNPEGVVEAFRRLLLSRSFAKAHLVLKINGGEENAGLVENIKESVNDLSENVTLINKTMNDNEVKNLIRCCDCFVSLHRSEGFGRGIAEAMVLGKPVIATAYSGNMDFVNKEVACGVSYSLTSLKKGDYPFSSGQVWADPDIDEAVYYMKLLLDNPEKGYEIGMRASLHMRKNFSYRSIGLRYKYRIDNIV